ncbi:MAG: IS30 family transposase [Armatimonadetes bacterium]|nr:MAG: IS30 family transposase [Armatimonadota bacterium]
MCTRERKPREGSLTLDERVEIAVGIRQGESLAEIGRRIGRPRQTVSAEVKRHGGVKGYHPLRAQDAADRAARRPRRGWIQTRPEVWDQVVACLKQWWSPEQIAVFLRHEHPDDPYWWVSHESIYHAVYVQAKGTLKAELVSCLRRGRTRRKPRATVSERQSRQVIPDMVMISERPPEVDDRAIPGHWEGDLIVGKGNRTFVATLVERRSRFGLLVKIDSKDAAHVAERIAAKVSTLPEHLVKSLTWDQGREMTNHVDLAVAADIDVYFCDPRSPWQRGSNENWNGLVRQYLPKGTDLSLHSQADLDKMAISLNQRPRKTLGWKTPAEVFNKDVTLAA